MASLYEELMGEPHPGEEPAKWVALRLMSPEGATAYRTIVYLNRDSLGRLIAPAEMAGAWIIDRSRAASTAEAALAAMDAE